MSTPTIVETRNKELEPDLFKAAKEDDVETLRSALKAGQSLNAQHERMLGMTPIHLACIFRSHAFLEVAVKEGEIDPWLRDGNGRVPFDHAWAKKDRPSMIMMYHLMYPDSPRQFDPEP